MDELTQGLRLEHRGAIAVVRLDRPTRLNAVTQSMWRSLATLFTALEADPVVRGVILTGAGGVFSAGGDITEFDSARGDPKAAEVYEADVDAACDAIASLSKPTVATIEGVCYGGACHLAMACDFRFAASEARLAIPAARLAVVYSTRGLGRLLALVGLTEAKRIMFEGRPIEAGAALARGLIDRITADPLAEALSYLDELSASSPLSLAASKYVLDALAHPAGAPLNPEHVTATSRQAVTSHDYAEARRAFSEKRQPRFRGS